MTTSPVSLVLIRSPTGKSGTNFLLNALLSLGVGRLPSADPLRREDHFSAHADLLRQYASATALEWRKWPELEQQYFSGDTLVRALGEGLQKLAGVGDLPAVVLKTPHCKNLRVGWALFPEAYHIVIVRDGRDVVESGIRAGYWKTIDEAAEAWRGGVAVLRDSLDSCSEDQRTVTSIIRYEDLLEEPRETLFPVVAKLGYALSDECFSEVRELPIYGSSQYGVNRDGSFVWRIAQRTQGFNPIGRWRSWDTETVDRVVAALGAELEWLGYDVE